MPKKDVPYSERPDWQDVTPVPQDDGPEPLVVIRYPPGFEEVHSYFRAIQQKDEFSERALALTNDVIEHNAANYTAWYYRRRCLKELDSDMQTELDFIDMWAKDSPKNYQVWYHRRWLISEIERQLQEKVAQGDETAAARIKEIGDDELAYHMDVMQANDDFKNYNGWSHRGFIVHKFNLWGGEMDFVNDLLRLDIRNNSAWNHRFTVLKNTKWPLTDETRQAEVDFTLGALRRCVRNESAWNYLAAFLGEGEGKVPWHAIPAIEAFCLEAVALAPEKEQLCRFAVEGLARVHEGRGELEEAERHYATLKDIDSIRASYWDWRVVMAQRKSSKGVAEVS